LKPKHLEIRKKQCDLIASASTCCRRKVGCVILNPETNVVISEGYNGPPRGANGSLCGGDLCEREVNNVPSGTANDIGCHHAEMNAIFNAARRGSKTENHWLISSCDPCLMCAKAIHHAGIIKVYAPLTLKEHSEGVKYLSKNGVGIEKM
jgi:dCMP deaminase